MLTPHADTVPHEHLLAPHERSQRVPVTLWLTGLPGSGKSTLAMHTEAALVRRGVAAYAVDGDNLRQGLCKGLGFSDADRSENIRRAAEVCRLLNEAGLVAICALVSPLSAQRAMAREIVGAEHFVEVHVATPLAVCEARDPKGLYRRARAGELRGLTGVDGAYEEPRAPEARIDTAAMALEVAVEHLVGLATRPRPPLGGPYDHS
jgi:adenylylsulfate kinase